MRGTRVPPDDADVIRRPLSDERLLNFLLGTGQQGSETDL